MDCSPPGFSVRGISQTRILEQVAISFSRGPSQPSDQTLISCIPGRFSTTEPPGRANVSSVGGKQGSSASCLLACKLRMAFPTGKIVKMELEEKEKEEQQ